MDVPIDDEERARAILVGPDGDDVLLLVKGDGGVLGLRLESDAPAKLILAIRAAEEGRVALLDFDEGQLRIAADWSGVGIAGR